MKKIIQNNLGTSSNHQKCYLRDRLIYDKLEEMKLLNTDQIAILFFESRLKVAQRRLEKLYKKKRLKRIAVAINQPLCYYLPDTKQAQQVEHTIMTNWIYVWFKLNLNSSYESIFHFSYEKQNEILRYDGFIGIENKFTKEIKFYFIETDLSNNKFDKVQKYNKYYEDGLYINEWWFKYASRFPAIIVLTHRENTVHHRIYKDNIKGLEFIVHGLDLVDNMREMLNKGY